MQRYTDYVINQNGTAVSGAYILVLQHGTSTPATLYSDDGVTSKANPVVTDGLGQFWFYAADGRYDLQISGAGSTPLTISDILLEDPEDGSNANFNDVTANSLTLAVPLPESSGGTGESSYTNGQVLIGNAAGGLTKTTLTAGAGVSIVNGDGSITISAPQVGTVTSVDLTAGTGISVAGGPITSSGSITVTNTAPDQVVALTQGGTTTITGTYPNFTISSADQYSGTVTSVDVSGGTTGLTTSGGPITGSGTVTLGGTLAVTNGGTGATTNTDARTNLDVYSKTETDNKDSAVRGDALAFAIALG